MIDPTEDLLYRGLLPRLDHRVNGMTADRLPAEVVEHAAAETAGWAAYVLDACACCCPDGPPTYGAPGWSRQDGDHKIALVASQVAALWSSRDAGTRAGRVLPRRAGAGPRHLRPRPRRHRDPRDPGSSARRTQ